MQVSYKFGFTGLCSAMGISTTEEPPDKAAVLYTEEYNVILRSLFPTLPLQFAHLLMAVITSPV